MKMVPLWLVLNRKYYCSNHTVPRYSTVGVFVMVCDGENPRMLAMNGHSASSLAVPIYVKAGSKIPECVHGEAMRILSDDFRAKAYTAVGKKKLLNKELISRVLSIKQPKIEMPKEMPTNIVAFNAKIDKKFAKHEKRVRKVLSRY